MHTHRHTQTHTCTDTHRHKQTQTHTHTHKHKHTHAHTQKHTNTHTPLRSLRSLEKYLLVIPAVRTKHCEAAFSCYNATQLQNQLPDDIKCAPTVAGFKSRLKTQLFSDQMLFVN